MKSISILAIEKNRPTSIPFVTGVCSFGIASLLFDVGPRSMTYVMFLQEHAITNAQTAAAYKVLREGGPIEIDPNTPRQPFGQMAGGGGGPPNREEIFKNRDADGNDKLEGAEISDRMQARLAEMDTDADGAISKDEFLNAPRPGGN